LDQGGKSTILYRMVMPDHRCPYGLKSQDLLERHGLTVEDITSKRMTKPRPSRRHGVDTTPQTRMLWLG
jgi:hypothetical protein